MLIERRIRWVIALVLLCGLGHTVAFAYNIDRSDRSKAWGYQPIYTTTTSGNASYNACGTAAAPSYQFHTTSAYLLYSDNEQAKTMLRNNGARKSTPWDEWGDDDDEIGTVTPTTPVGDTPWIFILLLAVGYIVLRSRRAKKKV